MEEAVAGNKQPSRPCPHHPRRERFLESYRNGNYHAALKRSGFYREFQKQAVPYGILLFLSRVKRAIIK